MLQKNNVLIKKYKKEYKQLLKNKEAYTQKRNQLINYLLTRRAPRWGAIKITAINI